MDFLAALALQLEWGADEALELVAPDRLAPVAAAVPARPRQVAPTLAAPVATAVALPHDMAALLAAYAAFDGCALRDTATNFVAPDGDAGSGLVWLTGPPDAAADQSGRPAGGADGALLDRMLASIGLTRGKLLVVPVVPWRPPGGRPPSAAEITACLPFLQRLLALARPQTLVLEAGLPVQALGARGRREAAKLTTVTLPDLPAPVAAVLLPSLSSIRQSAERRREAWSGLRQLRRRLDAGLPEN